MLMITLKITVTRSIALKWWNLKWDLANSPSFVTNRRQFSSSSEGRICKRSFFLFIFFFLVSSKVLIGWILVHKCLPNNVVGLTWKFPLIAPVERGVLCTGSKSLSSSLEPEKSTRYYIELMSLVYILFWGWFIWLKIIFPV